MKAVIFGFKGVFIDNTKNPMIEYLSRFLGVGFEEFEKVYLDYKNFFEKGFISEEEFWRNICEGLSVKKNLPKSLWKDAFSSCFKEKNEMILVLKLLKKQGYKVGLLSNIEIPAKNYILDKKFLKLFDAKVFSCTEKVAKPDFEVYYTIVQKLKVKPKDALFVDDDAYFVKAASKTGIKGIMFTDSSSFIKDLEDMKIKLV